MNRARSNFKKNLLFLQGLRKRNHNFPRSKRLLPSSCTLRQFPLEKTVNVKDQDQD